MDAFKIAGLVLVIFGLMGIIGGFGPMWVRWLLLALGVASYGYSIYVNKK